MKYVVSILSFSILVLLFSYACYTFKNAATDSYLFSDYADSGSLVYQLNSTDLKLRFVPAGDGSWYITYEQLTCSPPVTYTSYGLGPVSSSTGAEIDASPRSFSSRHKWLIYREVF